MLDDELDPEEAVRWREIIEGDENRQQQQRPEALAGGISEAGGTYSEYYQAGLPPHKSAGGS